MPSQRHPVAERRRPITVVVVDDEQLIRTALRAPAVVAADKYTYEGAPAITSLAPKSGPVRGAQAVTITGTNFTGASAVKFRYQRRDQCGGPVEHEDHSQAPRACNGGGRRAGRHAGWHQRGGRG